MFGVDDDAPLGAAERQPCDGALPRHPHRQGLDFVKRDALVVADAALGRPPGHVVLDPVAFENAHRAVVHLHREADDELTLHLAEHGAESRFEVGQLRSLIELPLGVMPWVFCGRAGSRRGCNRVHLDTSASRRRIRHTSARRLRAYRFATGSREGVRHRQVCMPHVVCHAKW